MISINYDVCKNCSNNKDGGVCCCYLPYAGLTVDPDKEYEITTSDHTEVSEG